MINTQPVLADLSPEEARVASQPDRGCWSTRSDAVGRTGRRRGPSVLVSWPVSQAVAWVPARLLAETGYLVNILSIIAGLFGAVVPSGEQKFIRELDRARRYQECAVGGWRFWSYDPPPSHEMVETKMLMGDEISTIRPCDMHPATNICDRLWRYFVPMMDITS